jgi:hypothetical protein
MDTPTAEQAYPPATESNERTHDVFFTTSAGRLYLRNPNRGVTLGADHIAWTFADKADGAPFKNVVQVNLHSGGSWQAPINLCEVTFADRYKLIVVNGDGLGFKSAEQSARYRDFVHDLHARLAAHAATRAGTPIAFTGGYPAGRYLFLLVPVVILGLICVGLPLVILLLTGEVRPLMLLIVGALFIWPLKRMMANNTPRTYDPMKLPKELVG